MSAARTLAVPDLSLVVLVGASGSGKSTFARRHFRSTQVLSSDACRGMVADDPPLGHGIAGGTSVMVIRAIRSRAWRTQEARAAAAAAAERARGGG